MLFGLPWPSLPGTLGEEFRGKVRGGGQDDFLKVRTQLAVGGPRGITSRGLNALQSRPGIDARVCNAIFENYQAGAIGEKTRPADRDADGNHWRYRGKRRSDRLRTAPSRLADRRGLALFLAPSPSRRARRSISWCSSWTRVRK